METEDDINVNLKQFKGHYRKFPWTLLLKVIIVAGFIAMIFYVTGALKEIKTKQGNENPALEIEIIN